MPRLPVKRIKLITFDAVNTIIKVSPSPAKQYAEVANKFGLNVTEEKIDDVYEKSWNDMKLQYPNYGRQYNMTSKEWWNTFITSVFRNATYSDLIPSKIVMDNITNDLHKRFLTKDSWEVAHNLQVNLQELRDAGLKLAVVSNFDERLSAVLSSLCLQQHFDFLVTSVSAGAEKPDPSIFRCALDIANAKPDETIHIGDSLEEDFIPAKNIGIHSYLYVGEYEKPSNRIQSIVGDQFLIKNFRDFRSIVLNLLI